MRNKLLPIVAAVMFTVALTTYAQTKAATNATATVTTQWDYWSFMLPLQRSDEIAGNLSKAGRDGWELVAVASPNTGFLTFFFKRPSK